MATKKTVWERNFATNERVREQVKALFAPKLKSVQQQRETLEQDWMRFYNMWNVKHDEYHSYSGQSRLYIPEVRKNVEAQARMLTDTAFPDTDFFDCVPGPTGTYKGASVQKLLARWQMHQAGLRNKFFVFARQECLYGTSPARVTWDEQTQVAFSNARDKKTGKLKMTKKLVELYKGPTFQPRDLMKWYPLNNRKADFREDGCFENLMVDRAFLDTLEKKGMLWNKDEIFQKSSDMAALEEMDRDIERAETLGLPIEHDMGYAGTASLHDDDKEKLGLVLLQEIYTNIVCPEACLEDEDPEKPIPMVVYMFASGHVGYVGRNPYWHQRPPYLVGKYIYPNSDEFYGQGIPKAVQYQQYELNSKAEQAMDSVTMALNPIAIIDPAYVSQQSEFEIEPAAIWFANPAGVKLAQMPDVSPAGYAAIAQLRSQIQDYSDRAPALPAQFQGKSRTATQSEIIDRSMSIDIKQFQAQNEIDVLCPMLEMWQSLTDQYGSETQMIMILGKDASNWKRMAVSKEMYLGDYKYFWKVSSDFGNRTLKSRQMIDMMKVAGSLPPEALQKLNFNFAEAYRILWKDIMNLPDAEKVIPDPLSEPTQDPAICLQMIKMGLEVEILPSDDNRVFMQYYAMHIKEEKDKDLQAELLRQIMLHKQQFELKSQILAQEIQQRQQQMMIEQQQSAGKRQGGMQGSGNRTQLSPVANTGDQASGVRA